MEALQEELLQSFRNRFRRAPEVLSAAPGRLEILGNHTDYNEGFVLSAATGQKTCFAAAKAPGRICRVLDCVLKEEKEIDPDDPSGPVKGDWANYLKGALAELSKRGAKVGAFDMTLASSVPLSAGMSSSAALEMAFCYALKELYTLSFTPGEWARIGQGVENNFMGLKTGLLDQFSSLYGKKDSLILCDFRSVEVLETVPMVPGYRIVVVNTLVKHNLVESDYNQRRKSCENACNTIRSFQPEVKALRDVSSSMLEKYKSALPVTDYRRALHVVGENERVKQGVDLLKKGDMEGFGKLLFESHESSRNHFENSCPELDALVEIAKTLPGCVGARLSGGGFGGITIHLVKEEMAEEYCKRIGTAYRMMTGKECKSVICSIGDGAESKRI